MNRQTLAIASGTEIEVRRFWAKVALPDENGCMFWTASRTGNGYGQFRMGGTMVAAHRLSLWIAAGAPDDSRTEAAHSCGNKRCVAPAHLRWATHAENEADKISHGTLNAGSRNGLAKLTDEQVVAIRSRYAQGGIAQQALGAEYGISQSCVSLLVRGINWTHVVVAS